jgi:hypothetical protein
MVALLTRLRIGDTTTTVDRLRSPKRCAITTLPLPPEGTRAAPGHLRPERRAPRHRPVNPCRSAIDRSSVRIPDRWRRMERATARTHAVRRPGKPHIPPVPSAPPSAHGHGARATESHPSKRRFSTSSWSGSDASEPAVAVSCRPQYTSGKQLFTFDWPTERLASTMCEPLASSHLSQAEEASGLAALADGCPPAVARASLPFVARTRRRTPRSLDHRPERRAVQTTGQVNPIRSQSDQRGEVTR